MRKRLINLLPLLILIFASCKIIEYNGTRITKLSYKTVDYMGGATTKYELDFEQNCYRTKTTSLDGCECGWTTKRTFTEKEEKLFIDSCYSYGLFKIKEKYVNNNVDDGGGWELVIEYEDGSVKKSSGSNARPDKVFSDCATVFYDLCGESVISQVSYYYINPPRICCTFRYYENESRITEDLAVVTLANYKWYKNESINNDLFLLNENNKSNKFNNSFEYIMILNTRNYDCDIKYNKLIIKEYDYNSELTNEKIIYESKYVNKRTMQIEVSIKLNKIYVYELLYKNGNYVQLTFNTYCE